MRDGAIHSQETVFTKSYDPWNIAAGGQPAVISNHAVVANHGTAPNENIIPQPHPRMHKSVIHYKAIVPIFTIQG